MYPGLLYYVLFCSETQVYLVGLIKWTQRHVSVISMSDSLFFSGSTNAI